MTERLKGVLIVAGAFAALAGGGAAIAGATGGGNEGADDDAGEASEQVRDANQRERASAAAIEAAGGGTVTEVERADEGDSGYEVEVQRRDGSFLEVQLDERFDRVSVEADDD